MMFTISDSTLYYETCGPEDGGAVVFIHGVGMDHRTFAVQAEALKERFRVITLDLPGHGASGDISTRMPYSRTAARLILELLDHLGISQAVLVGQSLGSFVSQHAASLDPQRIIGTVHIGGGPLYPRYSPLLRLLRPAASASLALFPFKPLVRMFARHKALKPETQAYLREAVSANGKEIIVRLTSAMASEMAAGIDKPIEGPMLLTCGDHDLKFIRKMSISWHKRQPESTFALIDQAHHIANQDNPEGFHTVLIPFLEEVFEK